MTEDGFLVEFFIPKDGKIEVTKVVASLSVPVVLDTLPPIDKLSKVIGKMVGIGNELGLRGVKVLSSMFVEGKTAEFSEIVHFYGCDFYLVEQEKLG